MPLRNDHPAKAKSGGIRNGAQANKEHNIGVAGHDRSLDEPEHGCRGEDRSAHTAAKLRTFEIARKPEGRGRYAELAEDRRPDGGNGSIARDKSWPATP